MFGYRERGTMFPLSLSIRELRHNLIIIFNIIFLFIFLKKQSIIY